MRQYDPYRFQSRLDNKKKKKRSPVQKAVIFGAVLFCLLVLGTVVGVILDAYDYSPSNAISDLMNPDRQEETTQEAPAEYESANFLAFITANRSNDAYVFAVIHAGLDEKTFGVIVLPPDTLVAGSEKEETLEELLFSSGAESVCRAVEKMTGIKIARHIRATQGGFEKLVDKLGGVRFNVERDLVYSSAQLSMHVQGGEQTLTGSAALNVMRYPEWEEYSDLHEYKIQAMMIAALIDQHFTQRNADKGDDLFNALINLVQSDISVADYRAYSQMIISYAAEEKNPTTFAAARGTYVETESGKRGFRLTGTEDFKAIY